MYCKFCGNKMDDRAQYCQTCGKMVASAPDSIAEESREYVNPIIEDKKSSLGRNILVESIIGLVLGIVAFATFSAVCTVLLATEWFRDAFSVMLVTLPVNIVGLCFSRSARAKLKKHLSLYGKTSGTASVGNGISIPANIINISLVILQAFIFIFVCVMLFC